MKKLIKFGLPFGLLISIPRKAKEAAKLTIPK